MIQGPFQHRSGRVIAVGRAVLSLFFLVAIWLDHSQPLLLAPETYALLAGYVVAAAAILLLTWNDWWRELRLAGPAHVLDLLVFLWINFATQGYASPFFTFFVFLVLSAAIRWGWRAAAVTSGVIILLYIGSAMTSAAWGTEAFDLRRFLLRSSYLVVMTSMVVLWLVSNRSGPAGEDPLAALVGGSREGRTPDMEPLLRLTAHRFEAPRALLVWSEEEEPWTYVSVLADGRFSETRVDPDRYQPVLAPEAGKGAILFDQRRGRVLSRGRGRRRLRKALEAPVHPALAAEHGLDQGLRLPIHSALASGELLVLDVPGLAPDDLERAEQAAAALGQALEHRALFDATEEAAAMRARLSLARDLHDSVVQFLAGLAFRLEGLRKGAGAGRDIGGEVDELQRALAGEQQDLRRFIAELRAPPGAARAPAELAQSLRELASRIASQWGVECRVITSAQRIEVPPPLERNVRQLVREAVANAVRHGRATAIETRLVREQGALRLEISDNGTGFPEAGEFGDSEMRDRRIGPVTLRERVHNLGGTLRLASSREGARISIALPLEEAA